jgi:2-dehydro-3-deoxygalactonokinase
LSGVFIAGDWGTSRSRLFLCDGDAVLDRVEGPGIGQAGDPAAVFADTVARWADYGPVPAILGGMVGSTLGWVEAPYLDCPADVAALAGALVRFESAGRAIAIAPGLASLNLLGGPDVMRGEETQILGALALAPRLASGRHILCLPGTHAKWVVLRDGRVATFQTSLTGELFACLRDHSVLGRDTDGAVPAMGAAFTVGLNRAFDPRRPALAHLLFEARSRRLREHMSAADALSFLSGLTIGADVAGMLDLLPAIETVTLVGAPALTDGYAAALDLRHIHIDTIDGDAAALAGLRAIAAAAGLLGC